jgi:toxin FitB
MKYLVDTNVISELKKPRPEVTVLSWLGSISKTDLGISVLTLGEIEQGIGRVATQAKAHQLQAWLEDEIKPRFRDRILGVDEETASIWARETGRLMLEGKTPPLFDSLIAATAIRYNLTFVTRNVKHVQDMPVKIFNPWTKES